MKQTMLADLYDFADWDIKTTRSFERYLEELEATPSSKVFLSSTIKFEEMYQPLWVNPYSWKSVFGEVQGENEYRRLKRAQIYLHKKDLVKVVDRHGGKRLILTTRAHRIFYKDYPLAKLRQEKWSGNWTIVMYDLPEKRKSFREYLRKKLRRLGFGSPQESVLVSPLPLAKPVQDLVEGEGAGDDVWVVLAKRVLGLTNREVAERAWRLESLNQLYQKLLEVFPRAKRKRDKGLLAGWQRCFLALDNADPYLPVELLSEDWQGEKCRQAAQSLEPAGLLKVIFG